MGSGGFYLRSVIMTYGEESREMYDVLMPYCPRDASSIQHDIASEISIKRQNDKQKARTMVDALFCSSVPPLFCSSKNMASTQMKKGHPKVAPYQPLGLLHTAAAEVAVAIAVINLCDVGEELTLNNPLQGE